MSFGRDSYCNTPEMPDHVIVGNYTSIAAHCIFHDVAGYGNHPCIENPKLVYTGLGGNMNSKGKIDIGNDVWIGDGVRLLTGITIGDGAIIGAGAVISKDVPPYAVVVGNPQVIKKYRFTEDQIKKLLKIQWWNWPADKVKDARFIEMQDIDKFLELHS